MQIQVIFDHDRIDKKLNYGWGIAFLIGGNVLFDTCEKFEYLLDNAQKMNIDLAKIAKVVISHEHWDHTNGLWELIKLNKNLTVYIASGFSQEFKEKVKNTGAKIEEISDLKEVEKGIFVMGDNRVMYKGKGLVEQMMVIKDSGRLTLVCACCHPGILNILHKTANLFHQKVDCVFGGLHFIDKEHRFVKYIISEMVLLTSKVYSAHCTGHEAQETLKAEYKENFLPLKSGMKVEV